MGTHLIHIFKILEVPGIEPAILWSVVRLSNPVDEGFLTSHLLKWGPFLPNEVGRIAQHVRKGEGRKEEKARM